MDLDHYQQQAATTAVYPGQGGFLGLAYAALGLNGEAGECAEQVKKTWRDQGIDFDPRTQEVHISDERHQKIRKELGDTLWYAAQVANELGESLSDIANENLHKLAARHAKGTLAGDGSDR
jgi:NTP pyrophosphatase (non-canonical NTP hydrolase)